MDLYRLGERLQWIYIYRLRECNAYIQAMGLAMDLYRLGDCNESIQARRLKWIYIG